MDQTLKAVVPGPFPFRVEIEQVLRRVGDIEHDLLAERQEDLDRQAGRKGVVRDGFVQIPVIDVAVVTRICELEGSVKSEGSQTDACGGDHLFEIDAGPRIALGPRGGGRAEKAGQSRREDER